MQMSIELRRRNEAVHFEAKNDEENTVLIDGSPKAGGQGLGFRPMELLLAAIGSCASMDVVPILAKQRQQLDDIRVTVSGERSDGEPSPFTSITLHFDLFGHVDSGAAQRALDLAVHKYCSVGAMLQSTADVSWTMRIHGTAPDEESQR